MVLTCVQVELNLLEAEGQFGVNMDGLEVTSFEVSPGNAVDDLYICMGHSGQQIAGRLEYNNDVISPSRAARIAADWLVGGSHKGCSTFEMRVWPACARASMSS